MAGSKLVSVTKIEERIFFRAVQRNRESFPDDFMFQLTEQEYEILRCQFGILRWGQHSKYLPYAFTEHGVAMLSSVLKSKRARRVNIEIIRAFVRLRRIRNLKIPNWNLKARTARGRMEATFKVPIWHLKDG